MSSAELPDEQQLLARINELLDAHCGFAMLAARMDLPLTDPSASSEEASHSQSIDVMDEQSINVMDEVVQRLGGLLRDADFLALIAPSTFVVVGEDLSGDSIGPVEERLQGAFNLPVDLGGKMVSLVVRQARLQVDARPSADTRPASLIAESLIAESLIAERRGVAPLQASDNADAPELLALLLGTLD